MVSKVSLRRVITNYQAKLLLLLLLLSLLAFIEHIHNNNFNERCSENTKFPTMF